MTDVVIKSKIRIRRGLQEDLDNLPVGQKPLLGEILYTTDTKRLYVGVDEDSDPDLISTSMLVSMTSYTEAYRGGIQTTNAGAALNNPANQTLDIQCDRNAATQVAAAAGSICYGARNTVGVSGTSGINLGRGCSVNALGAVSVGRDVSNNVASTCNIGHTNALMRAESANTGWIMTIMSSASARTAGGSSFADAAAGTLPLGCVGFRRNGNQILIDINTDGTIRTLSLGTAT